MSEPNSTPKSTKPVSVGPLRCITGAAISGGLATAGYFLTISIIQTFANKPIHSDNQLTVNIASAVRTLVIGIGALGTGIFAIATLGLLALAVQLLIQRQSVAE